CASTRLTRVTSAATRIAQIPISARTGRPRAACSKARPAARARHSSASHVELREPQKKMMMIRFLLVLSAICLVMHPAEAAKRSNVTQVVVLGTGTPVPDPIRAGAGVAVIHKGEAYLFDAGDGVVSRAIRAHSELGMDELDPPNIRHVLFPRLHGDHIHDYSVLASRVWWRRNGRLNAWGPAGLKALTDPMNEMMQVEAGLRSRGTPADVIADPDGYRVEAKEISEGVVYSLEDLTIEAFNLPHGGIKPAF